MAIALYGGIGALGIILKPELINSMTDLMMLTTPFIAMFTWDKLKSGSVVASNPTTTTG